MHDAAGHGGTTLDVLGVGDADMDIYLDVDHIPARDEKVLARAVELHPGGMVANFVVALQKLGATCGFHGPVGDDDYGRAAVDNLVRHGVDTSGVIQKAGQQTYFCTVLLDASGEKALVVAPTPCLFPEPQEIQPELIARARHVHTTAANRATLERTLAIARAHGIPVSLDLEPTMLAQPGIESLLMGVEILFVNQRAIQAVHAASPLDAVRRLRALGIPTVCITLGAEGVVAGQGDRIVEQAGFRVPVVDTTGAGDCFGAGFVYGTLQGWPLEQTLPFATAVAAHKVMHRGGHSGSPSMEQVHAFLARA